METPRQFCDRYDFARLAPAAKVDRRPVLKKSSDEA
jgi:hypothetical protein